MSAYHLEPIPTLQTLRIVASNRTVGFLYPPKRERADWEITPAAHDTSGLPDGDIGYLARHFATEHDALAYLGLAPVEQAA